MLHLLHNLNDGVVTSAPALLVSLIVLSLFTRMRQRNDSARSHGERAIAREHGSHEARLLHPKIDLNKCIGCGACMRACPEEGVLSLLHGQALVVHGSRCVGHGECAASCPTGAISLTLGDLSKRRDLPAMEPNLEVVGVPGLFLAGELSGYALVRTAVSQGVAAADAVARRVSTSPLVPLTHHRVRIPAGGGYASEPEPAEVLDLLIVGAGPGGLACSLRAKQHELQYLTIEQEALIGGTIAAYPRKKMVMTQPLELPMYGRLSELSYSKEKLISIWEDAARDNNLPIRTGVKLIDLVRSDGGVFIATTSDGVIRARNVCLALGRRGSPRKLEVPGEDLPKVGYSLIDAASYSGRRILIVGGGDSAIEAALALAQQSMNEVIISYRKSQFVRIKTRNMTRISKTIQEARIQVLFESELIGIEPDCVHVWTKSGRPRKMANDDVFIFAGGDPPFPLLERAGVSFDPADRPPEPQVVERGAGLWGAILLATAGLIAVGVWSFWFRTYYAVDSGIRATLPAHTLLRSSGPVGIATGLAACILFAANLTYLVRRSPRWGKHLPGSLRVWMGWHVVTGVLAVLFLLIHSGFSIRPTVGGHALIALGLVIATGSIGRYFYAQFPRAANGKESSLDELRAQLAGVSAEWDRAGLGFGVQARQQIDELIAGGKWRASLLARIGLIVMGQLRLRRCLTRLRHLGHSEGIPEQEILHVLKLAKRAHQLTLHVMHYEEMAAVFSSWRYFHRWVGLLMVLLTVIHIVTATRYGSVSLGFFSSIIHPFR